MPKLTLKTAEDLKWMRGAGRLLSKMLHRLADMVEPGVATHTINIEAGMACVKHNVLPAFHGYNGFPAFICTSINDEVVHGVPSQTRIIQVGDLVKLDFGIVLNGYYADAAVTVIADRTTPDKWKLQEVTKECLELAIKQMVPGHRLLDIGRAVQEHAEKESYSVIKKYVGHGVGKSLHEGPSVPNYVSNEFRNIYLKPGMTFAVEPMVCMGSCRTKVLPDHWTVVTCDGQPSAHWEHTIAITEDGPEVLTRYEE